MPSFKPVFLGLGLIAGLTMAAQAQTVSSVPAPGTSIADLPPPGPRASSLGHIPNETNMPSVSTSGNYPGPAPGASNGQMPPRFEKPAGYDQNAAMHPYSSNMGPKPN